MAIPILPRHRRRYILLPPSLVHASINHNHIQLIVFLQDLDTFQRFPVDEDAIGVVARRYTAELFRTHEEFRNAVGRRDDGFMRCEAEEVDEVREVARVGAVRCPGESVVT